MTYSNFLRTMLTYQKLSRDMSELHDIGIDFFEGKYRLSELIYHLFQCSFESHYTKKGVEWIDWFIFDAEWGLKDFSKSDTFSNSTTFKTDESGQVKMNESGQPEIVEPDGEVKWGATDSEGNPIAYSFESLWELLEKDYKLKEQ